LIRILLEEKMDSGFKSIIWNALDITGSRVKSGSYVIVVESGNSRITKMMIIK
jgi:hypothetical protein